MKKGRKKKVRTTTCVSAEESEKYRDYGWAMETAFAHPELVNRMASVVIETNNPLYIYHFAAFIKDAPVKRLANAIIRIGDARYIYYFAKDVEGAPIDELTYGIACTDDVDFIINYACDIPNVAVNVLAMALIRINDPSYSYSSFRTFAIYVPGASIEDLEDATISSNDPIAIYLFALRIEGASKAKLGLAIIQTKSEEFICLFAANVIGVEPQDMMQAVKIIKDYAKENRELIRRRVNEA